MITSYWDISKLMSHNAIICMAVGAKSVGKTYSAKTMAMRRFLKTGQQFIYLRRYKNEISKERINEFFNDFDIEWPGFGFKAVGKAGYVCRDMSVDEKERKWDRFCLFKALSQQIYEKGVPLKVVDYIIFDEFIIEKGESRYLTNEPSILMKYYNSVDRLEDRVRLIMLANAETIMNPYFAEWDIYPVEGVRFIKRRKGYLVAELIHSEDFEREAAKTRYGQFIEGTQLSESIVYNRFKDDNDVFIKRLPKDAKPLYVIAFDGEEYSIWSDFYGSLYYISQKIPKTDILRFVVRGQDMAPNYVLAKKIRPLISKLEQLYSLGFLYYDKASTRERFSLVLKALNIY